MSEHKRIAIREVLSDLSNEPEERTCIVNIEVDGVLIHRNRQIRDPFRKIEDVQEHNWYLEECFFTKVHPRVPKETYSAQEQERGGRTAAEIAKAKLETYGVKLRDDLGLQDQFVRNMKSLHIDIWESSERSNSSFRIHQILWENLEQPTLWAPHLLPDTCPVKVMVRRIVPAEPSKGLPWEFRSVSRDSPIRVLLVIARKLTKTPENRYEDIKSHIAQVHLLSVQQDLAPLWYSHQIELEIVRPGTYSALSQRLHEEKIGYFDLVHFDLHGDIDDVPK